MKHTVITTPGGEKLVLVPLRAFEAMQEALDSAEHRRTMRAIASGKEKVVPLADVHKALDAPSLLAFWRKKAKLTQEKLAVATGLSQSYIAALEAGKRRGSPDQFLRISEQLGVRMEDLIE